MSPFPDTPIVSTGLSNIAALKKKSLFIELCPNSALFIVFDDIENQAVAIHEYRSEMPYSIQEWEQIKNLDFIINEKYRKINISWQFPLFSLLPANLYNDNLIPSTASIITSQADLYQWSSDLLEEIHCVNIYGVPIGLKKMFAQFETEITEQHSNSLWIESMYLHNTIESGSFAALLFYPNRFCVAYFYDKKLQFCNSFEYDNNDDIAYYLLALSKNESISVKNLNIKFFGNAEENDAIHSSLKRFFKNFSFAKRNEKYTIESFWKQIPMSRYWLNINQYLCV